MNTSRQLTLAAAAFVAALTAPLASAKPIIPSPAASQVQYHAEGGLTYASGVEKLIDQIETNFGFERKTSMPIGLKFSGYATPTAVDEDTPDGVAIAILMDSSVLSLISLSSSWAIKPEKSCPTFGA